MTNKHNKNNLIVFVGVISFALFVVCSPYLVNASNTLGTIDSVYRYAKGSGLKINFGLFKGSINVVVSDTRLSGFAWGESIGWINLAPADGGVLNNGEGTLYGYATSELGGWINFKPTGGGVTIDSNGEFHGYALSQKFGMISFNCSNDNSCSADDYKVRTDWRPRSVRGESNIYPPIVVVQPNNPPISAPIPDTTNDSSSPTTKIKPLPVIDTNQYYYGGDVVKVNGQPTTTIDGAVTYIMPTDEVSAVNKNKKNSTVVIENVAPPTNIIYEVAKKTKEIGTIIQEQSPDVAIVSITPAINISPNTVTTVGVVGGGTTIVSSLLVSALSVSEFFLNFLRLWTLFLSAIGLRKKRNSWGTVYDSVTKQPLDPVYVVLFDKNNKEVATAITDMDGRFGFLVPSGRYRIVVNKNNYIFPSVKLAGQDGDGVYENLYFGEDLFIEQGKPITQNIPMDPEKFDWNEFTKKDKNLLKFSSPYAKIISILSNGLFYLGFAFAILLLVLNGFNYYNVGMILFYIVLTVFKKVSIKSKTHGTIRERDTLFPMSFAVVRIFPRGGDKEIFHRVADKYGNYYCLLPKGEYYITIDKKNNDESYSNVYKSGDLIINSGVLNRDFVV